MSIFFNKIRVFNDYDDLNINIVALIHHGDLTSFISGDVIDYKPITAVTAMTRQW